MTILIPYIEALTNFGHPVAKHLRPGAASSAIVSFEKELNLKLPEELKDLFSAFDGTHFQEGVLLGHAQLIDGFHLMALDEVSSEKEMVDEIVEDFPLFAGEKHAFTGRNMLPIMADGLGNHIVIDVSSHSKHFGSVGIFDHAGESLTETFPSFQKLIEGHFEALKAGAYSMTDEGYMEADFDELEKILEKHQRR